MSETLEVDRRDKVMVVTFDTPERLNSITEDRLTDLEALLDEVEVDETLHALAFTGRGRAFCVGLDLDLLKRAFDDVAYFETVVRRLNGILLRIEALPFATIAAVNGYARAGGFELAIACDLLLIGEGASVGDNHAHVGVMPGGGSTQRLPRMVGSQRAKELIWSARWLTAEEAVAMGLALEAVPDDGLDARLDEWLDMLASRPRPLLSATKRAVAAADRLETAAGVEYEIQAFVDYLTHYPDARDGFRRSIDAG